MSKPKLISVQLETCHANHDATAWYAYFDGPLKEADVEAREAEVQKASKKDGAPLGLEFGGVEHCPNALTKHGGLWRYYVGGAV